MVLNLPTLNDDVTNIKKQGAGYKVIDAIQEARSNHNILVAALNKLSEQLEEIDAKLDAKADKNVVDDVKQIKDNVIPGIRETMKKNLDLSEAKIIDASRDLALKHEQLEAHGRRLNVIVNGCAEMKETVATDNGGSRQYEDTELLFRGFLVNSLKFSEEYVSHVILRDCHRLPKSKKRGNTLPPPIIAAFVSQRQRNEVLAAAKNLKSTQFSIKSDLPKRLNTIRSKMLQVRSDLKKDNKVVRLVERQYLPLLQLRDEAMKWHTIFNIEGPKEGIVVPDDVEVVT